MISIRHADILDKIKKKESTFRFVLTLGLRPHDESEKTFVIESKNYEIDPKSDKSPSTLIGASRVIELVLGKLNYWVSYDKDGSNLVASKNLPLNEDINYVKKQIDDVKEKNYRSKDRVYKYVLSSRLEGQEVKVIVDARINDNP